MIHLAKPICVLICDPDKKNLLLAYVCVCVCVCVRARARTCVCMSAHAQMTTSETKKHNFLPLHQYR